MKKALIAISALFGIDTITAAAQLDSELKNWIDLLTIALLVVGILTDSRSGSIDSLDASAITASASGLVDLIADIYSIEVDRNNQPLIPLGRSIVPPRYASLHLDHLEYKKLWPQRGAALLVFGAIAVLLFIV